MSAPKIVILNASQMPFKCLSNEHLTSQNTNTVDTFFSGLLAAILSGLTRKSFEIVNCLSFLSHFHSSQIRVLERRVSYKNYFCTTRKY
jgi:hypothetical protein